LLLLSSIIQIATTECEVWNPTTIIEFIFELEQYSFNHDWFL
jgi:hypothetical protein